MHARWGSLGLTRATFVSSSVAKAVSVLPSARASSLSVPLELSFSDAFAHPPPSEDEWEQMLREIDGLVDAELLYAAVDWLQRDHVQL